MPLRESPIVILDSTLAGLAVAKSVLQKLPHEHIVFLADTARGPYSARSAESIVQCGRQLVHYACELRSKLIVIACNTIAGATFPAIRREFAGISICSIIDPTAKAAVEAAGAREYPVIGVVAADATLRTKAYDHAIHRRRHHARMYLQPIPLLETAIEEGRSPDDKLLRFAMKQYFIPMTERAAKVIVCASSHCTVAAPMIRKILADDIAIIDSTECCADDVVQRLTSAGLWRESGEGRVECVLTDQPPRYDWLCRRFFGSEIPDPRVVRLDELFRSEVQNEPRPWRASA